VAERVALEVAVQAAEPVASAEAVPALAQVARAVAEAEVPVAVVAAAVAKGVESMRSRRFQSLGNGSQARTA
jgi:hypothetical protein